jgi:hypothetical protein
MSYRSVFRPGLFTGQTVLVTGGGQRHRPLHRPRARRAGRPRGADRPQRREARSDEAEIQDDGGAASHAPCDIREEEAVQGNRGAAIVDRARRIHGSGEQRGRAVHLAVGEHLRQGLAGGARHQSHRRLPDGARVLRAVRCAPTAAPSSTCSPTCGARHAGHGAQRRGPSRHAQLHRDGCLRMGTGAGQCGGAGLDRLERHGHLSRGDEAADPGPRETRTSRKTRHRGRGGGRRSCSCCRRPRRSSRAPACVSTARRRTRAALDDALAGKPAPQFDGFHRSRKPRVLGD